METQFDEMIQGNLDDDYTYVQGKGRGRYICDSCGIRCKKPSLLKKHVQTHSNLRPYTCKYCNFAFKTKSNLTKHIKSKTHYQKSSSTIPDDFNIIAHDGGQFSGLEDSEDEDMVEDEHLFKEFYKHSEKDERKIQSFYNTVKYTNQIIAEENSKSNHHVLTFKELWQRGLESSIKMECVPDIPNLNFTENSDDTWGSQNIIKPEIGSSEFAKDDDHWKDESDYAEQDNQMSDLKYADKDDQVLKNPENVEQDDNRLYDNEYAEQDDHKLTDPEYREQDDQDPEYTEQENHDFNEQEFAEQDNHQMNDKEYSEEDKKYSEPDPGYNDGLLEDKEYKVKIKLPEENTNPDIQENYNGMGSIEDSNRNSELSKLQENNAEGQEDIENVKHDKSNESTCDAKEENYKYDLILKDHENGKGKDEVEKHKCEVKRCKTVFIDKSKLLQHVRCFHDKEEAKCDQCHKVFNCPRDLRGHIERVHEGKKFGKCDPCDKMFSKTSDLRRHVREKHTDLKINIQGQNQTPRREYSSRHSRKIYESATCELCNKHFGRKGSLKSHIKKVHEKIKDFKCEVEGCTKEFFLRHDLTEHTKQIHEGIKENFCHLCGKHLNSKKSLTIHIKTVHEKIKDFVCEHCQYACSEISVLKNHIKAIHDKIKDNLCQTCGKGFSLMRVLKNHLKVHERSKEKQKDNGQKVHICDSCGKVFSKTGNMKSHINAVHYGQRDYKCDFCEKKFSESGNLKKHINVIHNGQKNHQCNLCGKSFSQAVQLKTHTNSVHNDQKDHKSDSSGKTFSHV